MADVQSWISTTAFPALGSCWDFFKKCVIDLISYVTSSRFVFLHNLISDSFFGISGIELMHGILNAALSFILIVFGFIIYGIRRRKL